MRVGTAKALAWLGFLLSGLLLLAAALIAVLAVFPHSDPVPFLLTSGGVGLAGMLVGYGALRLHPATRNPS
jgi:hypothetical protein